MQEMAKVTERMTFPLVFLNLQCHIQAPEQESNNAGWREIFKGAAGLVLYPNSDQTSRQSTADGAAESAEQDPADQKDLYNVSKDEFYFTSPVVMIGRKSKRDVAQVSSLDVASFRNRPSWREAFCCGALPIFLCGCLNVTDPPPFDSGAKAADIRHFYDCKAAALLSSSARAVQLSSRDEKA